jgi:toxin ParE1/3/4
MLPHNLRLILSDEAKADIVDILQYTYDTWGDTQANAYSAVIDKALSSICEPPYLGKKAPEISEHHRVMQAGQHIIFYTVMDSSIHIARVLHSKMDIKNRF